MMWDELKLCYIDPNSIGIIDEADAIILKDVISIDQLDFKTEDGENRSKYFLNKRT